MPTEPRNDDLVMSLVEQALAQAVEHPEAYLRGAKSGYYSLPPEVRHASPTEGEIDCFTMDLEERPSRSGCGKALTAMEAQAVARQPKEFEVAGSANFFAIPVEACIVIGSA